MLLDLAGDQLVWGYPGDQRFCAASDVYPCVFDAAILTSFDKGGWTEGNMVW